MHVATEILWNIAEKPKEKRSDSIIDPTSHEKLFIYYMLLCVSIN
jgi:hypothetical protein